MTALYISLCICFILSCLLLLEPSARRKKNIMQRWATSYKQTSALPKNLADNAFADSVVLTGWRNQLLLLKERISAVGGALAFVPIILLSCVLSGAVYYFGRPYGSEIGVSSGVATFIAGIVGGYRYLQFKLRKQFNESLPLAIDLVVRAVSAGVALPASFQHVAESIPSNVGIEFQRIYDATRIGKPVREALAQGVRRIPSEEFHFFAIVLSLNLETGGRLSESLGNLSTKLRTRRQMERKVKAMTSEPRSSAIIVAFFPPVFLLLLYFMNPAQLMFLFTDPTGQALMGYATISTILGILQLYRMTKVS